MVTRTNEANQPHQKMENELYAWIKSSIMIFFHAENVNLLSVKAPIPVHRIHQGFYPS